MKLYCNCTFVEMEKRKTKNGDKEYILLTILDEKRFANNVSIFNMNILDVNKLKPDVKLKLSFEVNFYNGKTNLRCIGCDVLG